MDQVDEIVKRWATERPEVDAAPLHVSARILLLSRQLTDSADAALAPLGLSLWQYDVLAALRRAGAPFRLSPTELARAVTLSTAAMTNRLDRLEAKGWIGRHAATDDRRGIRIQLTPAGRKLVDRAFPVRIGADRAALARLPARTRRELAGLLRHALCDDHPAMHVSNGRKQPR